MSLKCNFCGKPTEQTVFVSTRIVGHDENSYASVPCCNDPICLELARQCREREEQVSCETCKRNNASFIERITGTSRCPKERY